MSSYHSQLRSLSTDTTAVEAFVNSDQVHVVVAKRVGLNCVFDSTATLVFLLRNHRSLELIQRLPVINVRDIIHFDSNDKHYLALSDDTSVETSLNRQTIYVYRSDRLRTQCSFSLFAKLHFDNAFQLSAFTYGTVYSPNQYLLAANASQLSVWKLSGIQNSSDKHLIH